MYVYKRQFLQFTLSIIISQAFTCKQDFDAERAAREQAIDAKNTLYKQFSIQIQTLSGQLSKLKEQAETEKQEKQAVIAKLTVTVTEKQQLTRQLTQIEKDFDQTLATKLQEIEKIREETLNLWLRWSTSEQNCLSYSDNCKQLKQPMNAEKLS